MNASNPYAPPTATVSDVSPDVTVEVASRGSRLLAALIDGLISMAVALPIFLSLGLNWRSWGDPSAIMAALTGAAGMLSLLLWLALIVVTFYLVAKNSQTIGKKLVGIKVARSDGSRATLGRIFWLRNVVNVIPGMIPIIGGFYPLADHLWIFGEKRQCLHDKIADTIVIRA
ncbi:MAG TPA: RDD family protein [Povalibacter sp.]|jgi:uncharacterized RDD family membrane protein YckC|nr:RDD family protein [Povalibacter sp.]